MLIVLDGLDEVSSAVVRAEAIVYEDDDRVGYERLDLLPPTVDDATPYARRLLTKRFQDNPYRQEQTLQRIVD
ncbi:hypothetical protein [Amycolatopsis minnesotensis]|uniref:Uncharacterized protein n=1 Tax=Amycolatopsis minnesotensis TaxID=337894 RepID=A0ABP5DHQ4_9PSEU